MRFHWLLVVFLVFVWQASCLFAQTNTRRVVGIIQGDDDNPVPGVVITADSGETFSPDEDGRFDIYVPALCRELSFTAPYYFKEKMEIDGSFLLVKMRYDKVAKERERQAAEAKARAEEAARVRAENERLAAEEQARKEAEAKAKAEEEARVKAEKERLAAEEKARKEAEAKAKAEEEARVKVEKERLAAEEKARKEAEAKAKAEEKARAIFVRDSTVAALKQQKIDARKAADAEYNDKYKNRGIENTFEFGYAYQLLFGDLKEDLRYQYSGYRAVSPRHPVFVDYTFSYRFNRYFSLGVGAGFMYNLKSVVIKNDQIVGTDENWKEKRFDIPVYLDLKARFCRKMVRPLLDIKGGWYPMSKTAFIDGGFGVEFRTSRSTAVNLTASVRTTPFFIVKYDEISPKLYYPMCWSPSVRIGFAF